MNSLLSCFRYFSKEENNLSFDEINGASIKDALAKIQDPAEKLKFLFAIPVIRKTDLKGTDITDIEYIKRYKVMKNALRKVKQELSQPKSLWQLFKFYVFQKGAILTRKLDFQINQYKTIIDQAISVQDRLQKNKDFAQAQQTSETDKLFFLSSDQDPTSIDVGSIIPVVREINRDSVDVNGFDVGIASCQGRRGDMEDQDLAIAFKIKIGSQEHNLSLFGIFDGHGGKKASAFVKTNLVHYLKEALEKENPENLTDKGIFKALKKCFEKLDKDYVGRDGTTATIAVVMGEDVWVANVGDSRTLLVNNEGRATQASEDAKPSIARYKEDIEKRGSSVSDYGRLAGILAVARAIGDRDVVGKYGMKAVSPKPKITRYSLDEFPNGYIVLACDGLFDVTTTTRTGAAVIQMSKEEASPENIAACLVHSAITNGSEDNVSVMAVKLK